ncbi:MAG: GAF domain-containing protein [Anaerolineae bacterium]|nr:GAF domain-containing protein [Anaerolineae bacterium]
MATIQRILRGIFITRRYSSLVERDRARLVYLLTMILLGVGLILSWFLRSFQLIEFWPRVLSEPIYLAMLVSFVALGAASIVLTRRGYVRIAAYAPLLMLTIMMGLPTAFTGLYNTASISLLAAVVMLGGLLLGTRGSVMGLGLAIVLLVIGLSRRAVVPPPELVTQRDLLETTLALMALSLLTYLFVRFLRTGQTEAVEGQREDRLKLATITTQVAQRITRRMALSNVLSSAVDQVRDSYPEIYHVQIFLLDESGKIARLVASTGEVGRLLMERQHSLPVGSQSVIGQVTTSGRRVIAYAQAIGGETIHRRNELLPETAVEAAFPLRMGDRVIGALDLQSKNASTFEDDDLPIFQSLADHIAIAIDNARLYEETQRQLTENEQLVERTRQTALEVERLNQQLTGRFWEDFLSRRTESPGLTINFSEHGRKDNAEWTPTLKQALRYNHLVQERQDSVQLIAVPLRVRGQVIGAMEFELDQSGQLSPEDLNLIEEVGEQLGMAAENNRLFEATQRFAQREALVNEIATRLQASNNVETALNVAARSLKEALKANRVAIRLGTPPASSAKGEPA